MIILIGENMKYLTTFLCIVFLYLYSHVAFSSTATLEWEAPTLRENGVQIEQGELVGFELQRSDVLLDGVSRPIWGDSIDLSPDTTQHVTSELELLEGVIGWQWRIRAKDSEDVYSVWADSVKIIPHSPIHKMILNIVNNSGSIVINID